VRDPRLTAVTCRIVTNFRRIGRPAL